ncbi:MAG: hypothetical protein P1U34_12440 [Coxiellaceae bacterium]|nr:hypothetical protein [Coxiellaceae bacterium]
MSQNAFLSMALEQENESFPTATIEAAQPVDPSTFEIKIYPAGKTITFKLVRESRTAEPKQDALSGEYTNPDQLYKDACKTKKNPVHLQYNHDNIMQRLQVIAELLIKQALQQRFIQGNLSLEPIAIQTLVNFAYEKAYKALDLKYVRRDTEAEITATLNNYATTLTQRYSEHQTTTPQQAFQTAIANNDNEMLTLLVKQRKKHGLSAVPLDAVTSAINHQKPKVTIISTVVKHAKPSLAEAREYHRLATATDQQKLSAKAVSRIFKQAPASRTVARLLRKLQAYKLERFEKQSSLAASAGDNRDKAVDTLIGCLQDFNPLTCTSSEVDALDSAIQGVKKTGGSTLSIFRSGNRAYFDPLVKPLEALVVEAKAVIQPPETQQPTVTQAS